MSNFTKSRIKELFDSFKDCRVAVIGDLMLDSYMWGDVKRISPEAPVPVVEVMSESVKLGGAANVANNIINLGARAIPFGVVGDDISGEQIRHLFSQLGLQVNGVVTDVSRPTTIKTRIIANDQHVVRADVESKSDLSGDMERLMLSTFKEMVDEIDGVIFQDYNKGVITDRLIREVVDLCSAHNIFVTVDPKFNNFFSYTKVNLFKPNRRETEQVLGRVIRTDEDIFNAAQTLFERLSCKSILITRGPKGMSLFEKAGEKPLHIPTHAMKIHDVSGAGDTVISTIIVAKLAGATLVESAHFANYAAGIVCAEVGVVPIECHRLNEELLKDIDK
ncbi:D-glycero-beta-D-manno-heptose-7-phosphate kinase [candidate division LCP-89 bacterium B3_LCP]|uniref:D-glycero-beta-D-manno-heptose-7-phosphate kinase n=1 Tax=candidate division LCP-89 bacterium B3_LCP TaxID=2012998 RepID=A0A532UXW5_UNCL8|nr:MAG: D-glycero-beta-D-manno-heptose-7-phosphate kinase [candidate division LCP-89 bacterium B3_LCP]